MFIGPEANTADPQVVFFARTTRTYVIVTRAFLEDLFSTLSLPLPDVFKTPGAPFLSPNDALPPVSVRKRWPALVRSSCVPAFLCANLSPAGFEDNGVAHSFHSYMPIAGESGNGWVWVETVLVCLTNDCVPNAISPVWSADPTINPPELSIGYDVVFCVEICEPWIVQIYNSSLCIPMTMSIVDKSGTTDFETDDGNRGPDLDSDTSPEFHRQIPCLLRQVCGWFFI